MSVDKFGRSSASIARHRRPLALPPSRRQLLSVGALCRTGDYVDFNEALARNIGKPLLPSDAACKEYVDQSIEHVRLAVKKSVDDSIPVIVRTTHDLTVDFLNKQLVTVNDELTKLRSYIIQVEFNANTGEQKAVRDLKDVVQDVNEIRDEVTKMRDSIFLLENKLDQQVEKSNETARSIRTRIIELESLASLSSSTASSSLSAASPELIDKQQPSSPSPDVVWVYGEIASAAEEDK